MPTDRYRQREQRTQRGRELALKSASKTLKDLDCPQCGTSTPPVIKQGGWRDYTGTCPKCAYKRSESNLTDLMVAWTKRDGS